MKKTMFIVLLMTIIAILCGCDTGHKVTITHVTTEVNGQPTNITEVREYETNYKGEITKDSGWVLVESN